MRLIFGKNASNFKGKDWFVYVSKLITKPHAICYAANACNPGMKVVNVVLLNL